MASLKFIDLIFMTVLPLHVTTALQYVVIDTDGYNDDARALIIAMQQPRDDVHLLGITTVAGSTSVEQNIANINRLRRLINRMDTPIYKGSNTSLLNDPERLILDTLGSDGFGDRPDLHPRVEASDFVAHEKQHAAVALVDFANKYPNQLTLVTLGPLTNVALALRLDPSFAYKLKQLVIMGGNYLGIGNLGTWAGRPAAEYNFFLDPEAAETVLMDVRVPVVIVPWETAAMYSNFTQWQFLRRSEGAFDYDIFYRDNNVSKFLRGITEALFSETFYFSYIDDLAVAAALFPEKIIKKWMKFNSINVELRGPLTRGQMVVSWQDFGKEHPYQNITVLTDYHFEEMRKLMLDAVR